MTQTVVYFGFKRETEVVTEILDVGCGAGVITCTECGGTGDWPWYPDGSVEDCVSCKGTGKMYVSI